LNGPNRDSFSKSMNSIFKLGKCNIKKEKYKEFDIVYIYDFWENPDEILKLINNTESDLHWKLRRFSDSQKQLILPKLNNGKLFEDRRHEIQDERIKVAHSYVAKIMGVDGIDKAAGYGRLVTNIHKIYDNEFNDYKNNWWAPHKDSSEKFKSVYTCLWYFNKDDEINGTNIYEEVEPYYAHAPLGSDVQEQINPWVPKRFYIKKKLLKPTYNSAVIFPGGICFHGMNIENNRYANEYRINAALFLGQWQAKDKAVFANKKIPNNE